MKCQLIQFHMVVHAVVILVNNFFMNLRTLYKRNANGSINQWTIFVDENTYWTEYGQVGGAITKSERVYATPKNIGRSNETNACEQAMSEALAQWEYKQKSENYVKNIDDVDRVLYKQPMLANVYKKIYMPSMQFIQPKLDGIRCNISLTSGAVSRKNNKFVSVDFIEDEMKKALAKYPTVHLDGELYNHVLHDDFSKIVSLVKKQKLSEDDKAEVRKLVRYNVYDLWDDANPNMSFEERNQLLGEIVKGYDFVDMVPTVNVASARDIDNEFGNFVSEGYEGAIIRTNDRYEHKRCNNLLKYKEFNEGEFEILSIHEGKTKGIAEYAWIMLKDGECCKATLGFSDEKCKNILDHKDLYVGTMATVKYFGLTNDGKLRFPVIKSFRNYE